MTIKRGVNRRPRRNAKNFTSKPAQKRLDEALTPFRKQIQNSLSIDSAPAWVFKKQKFGRPCTCTHTEVSDLQPEVRETGSATIIAPPESSASAAKINIPKNNLFGNAGLYEDEIVASDIKPIDAEFELGTMIEAGALDDMDDEMREHYEEHLGAGNTVNCGVCYRSGFLPGYVPLGATRYLLTHYDMIGYSGYTIEMNDPPARFNKLTEDGYVRFSFLVPLVYKEASISVRNNHEILRDRVFHNGQMLTRAVLKQHAGKEIAIEVHSSMFTHVTVMFDMGADIQVNLSEEANTLDFRREVTIGNLQVVMPHNCGIIGAEDLIVVPSRNLALRITDAPRKQLVDRSLIEWNVSTRTLQPSEVLRHIHKGLKY